MTKSNRSTKCLLLLLSLALMFSLSACSDSNFPKPEESIKGFFEAAQKGDLKTVASYCTSGADSFDFSGDENAEKMAKLMFSKLKYEVLSSEVKDDTATAKLKITSIDMVPIMENMVADLFEMMMNAEGDLSEEETNEMTMKYFEDKISAQDAPTVTNEVEIKLKKNKDKKIWQIVDDDNFINAVIGNLGELMG